MNAATDQRESVVAYIALGANLGDARATVMAAMEAISQLAGVDCVARSELYKTAPIESMGADYINAVVKVLTVQPAYSLLSLLQDLEQKEGRDRPYRNAPRTLDLDLLLYGGAQISSDRLTVPHPRMWQRAFVLWPLRDVAPELVSDEALAAVSGQSVLRG